MVRVRRKDWEKIEKEKLKLINNEPVDATRVAPFILESWKRSIAYGVDPCLSKIIVSEATALSANPDLFIDPRIADADRGLLKIINAYSQENRAVIEVTDNQCKLVKVLAKPEKQYLSVLDDAENVLGTNAVFLTVHTKRATQVFGPEHFNFNISNSDCSTAPIFNLCGEIIGTLNIAARGKRHTRETLFIAQLLAGMITEYLLLENYKDVSRSFEAALSDTLEKMCDPDFSHHQSRIGYSRTVSAMQRSLSRKVFSLSHYEQRHGNLFGSLMAVYKEGNRVRNNLNLAGKKRVIPNKGTMYRFEDIIGASKALLQAKEMARKIAPSDASVLLLGESGTGKELFAQSIHGSSHRKNGPFISINCGAIPNELVESEFFGYEAGSFTGALKQGKRGKLVAASGGTLFLDEIESMPCNVQVKLLRVLSTGKVARIGGTEEIPVDIRVISATKKNLETECAEGRFREDLMFRINVITVSLPPLRERRTDIPLLVRSFIDRLSGTTDAPGIDVEKNAMNALRRFDWPGNIRQLENVIERALILLGDETTITLSHLPETIRDVSFKTMYNDTKTYSGRNGGLLRQVEKMVVREVLKEERGNVSQTAKRLGISRSVLYRTFKNVLFEYTR